LHSAKYLEATAKEDYVIREPFNTFPKSHTSVTHITVYV